ncbi:PepSY domain-containing protein [Rhodovulum strictum]|uniref:PepSY domain-containing protein n=1 Tax=Rhodovulum strictum TaxID=58314 RepID=A0A844BPS9_9RHOB|nr:PepSY domain-containing protein [Rhodovulum strictum]MRH22982.1 PepSY domain-containing protein [Rhodovulum strictum]
MTRSLLFPAAIAAALGLPAMGMAQATPDQPVPMAQPVQWMALGTLAARLEAQGYTLLEAEREDGRYWEVKMLDRSGARLKARFDGATGTPIGDSRRGND